MKTLFLTSDDTRKIVQTVGLNAMMDRMIARMSDAFRRYDPARNIIPERAGFNYTSPTLGLIEWMPVMEVGGKVTVKTVGYHPANPREKALPTILSTVSAYDTGTGHMTALVDGTFLTALRTGAASAIATRTLAHPDSKILGLVGCGAQAITQAHAISRLFDLDEVLLYDSDRAVAESFFQRAAFLDIPFTLADPYTPEYVLENSDIICTATSIDVGAGPVAQYTEVKPWLHVNAVGSDFPGKTEIPHDLLKRSFVTPDFHAQAVNEGECQQLSAENIGPELFEVLRNNGSNAALQQQMTVFDSTGWALEDEVAMSMLVDYANELNLGSWLQVETVSADPQNPYHFVNETPPVKGVSA